MKITQKYLLSLFICTFSLSFFSYAQKSINTSFVVNHSRYKLIYDKPSANWNEALPIGNGFLGAMVFGRVEKERLQLNESKIWGGGPNNIDTVAKHAIEEVCSLLNQKKYVEAQNVANKKLGPKGNSGMPY
jgi:alpha-L-fucosidase 2